MLSVDNLEHNVNAAKEVAENLYEYFAATGMLNVSCGSSAYTHEGFAPAFSEDIASSWRGEIAFASKAVQSVGYEILPLGSEEKPAVYVYASKGVTKKDENTEREINGCAVRYRRLTPLSIKPDTSQITTNIPSLFLCPNGEMACGSSCSLSTQTLAGTMGALLEFNEDNQLYLLSNNHVIGGCNHAEKNAIITMPAPRDSGRFAPSEVGTLSAVIPLESGNPEFVPACDVDAAIGRVTYPDRVTSWQGTLSEGYDSPSQVLPLTSGMKVKKFGRTTGLTHGVAEAKTTGNTKIPYKAEGFNATVYFKDFWLVRGENEKPFALAGDSGSLVVTEDGSATVGLLFANDNRYACILPIQAVLNRFGGAKIVTRYRIPNTSG